MTGNCLNAHRKATVKWAMRSALALALVINAKADLPAGYGKDATIRICGRCHSPERAASMHQTRSEWEDTVSKMLKLGAQGTDEELDEVVIYLTTYFGPQKPAPLNMNSANEIDLQTTLLLRRSQARAIIQYRTEKGEFKSMEDLRHVPGLDFAALEAKKSRIIF